MHVAGMTLFLLKCPPVGTDPSGAVFPRHCEQPPEYVHMTQHAYLCMHMQCQIAWYYVIRRAIYSNWIKLKFVLWSLCYASSPNKHQQQLMVLYTHISFVNSLAPGRSEMIDDLCIPRRITLRWISLDCTDNKSTLVQTMAWCRQATLWCFLSC